MCLRTCISGFNLWRRLFETSIRNRRWAPTSSLVNRVSPSIYSFFLIPELEGYNSILFGVINPRFPHVIRPFIYWGPISPPFLSLVFWGLKKPEAESTWRQALAGLQRSLGSLVCKLYEGCKICMGKLGRIAREIPAYFFKEW